jgi:hypothetical protein
VARFPKGYAKPTDACESCLAWGNFSGSGSVLLPGR